MILDNPDNVVVFETGSSFQWCSWCGCAFEGTPESCLGCGRCLYWNGTATVTKVDYANYTFTVDSPAVPGVAADSFELRNSPGSKDPFEGMNRAQRRAARRSR